MKNNLWYSRNDHIPVLGHRGICAKFPENTLISFEAAIRLGVDLIEFDVNITRNCVPVVIHDNDIGRTSDHEGLTREYTLAELKSFDFGGYFDEKFKGTNIPTLEEVLYNTENRPLCYYTRFQRGDIPSLSACIKNPHSTE